MNFFVNTLLFGLFICFLQISCENLRNDQFSIQWRNEKRHKKAELRNSKKLNSLKVFNQKFESKFKYYANVSKSEIMGDNYHRLQFEELLIYESYPNKLPLSMGQNEGKNIACSFLGAKCSMELIEHFLVRKFISKSDTVLELGARFGTTMCEIASVQENSGKLVSVEPDQNVWYLLQENKRAHYCSSWIFGGIISNTPNYLKEGSYDSRTFPLSDSKSKFNQSKNIIENLAFEDIQKKTNLQFNVLLIDCEGCIESFLNYSFEQLLTILAHVEKILLEADMSLDSSHCSSNNCIDYKKWINTFSLLGFSQQYSQNDDHFRDIIHYVFIRTPKSS